MKDRSVLPLFAATLFTSAFLIFAVQPMASKMLLPLLGGSPSVWNTAMVFFQAMLLAGYAYAHFIAKYFSLKIQALLHLVLFGVFTLVLPLSIPSNSYPPNYGGQEWWQLGLMLTSIGGPFFVLAASAPLFQHWFASSGHKDAQDPYFLYGVSNIGSMVALLGYPFIIEPLLTLPIQTGLWLVGYLTLILLTAGCAFSIRNGIKPSATLTQASDRVTTGWKQRAIWIILAFIPSSLMLGVTTHISTDLASAPLLWVVPLALYLITFIIAFARTPSIDVARLRIMTAYGLALVLISFVFSSFYSSPLILCLVHLGGFFLCSLLCHAELSNQRPGTSRLTEYYLLISVGGVLGGIFNALLAPNIFSIPLEYTLTLSMVGFVIWAGAANIPKITLRFNTVDNRQKRLRLIMLDGCMLIIGLSACLMAVMTDKPSLQTIGALGACSFAILLVKNHGVFALYCTVALMAFQSSNMWSNNMTVLATKRNYFGTLKVYQRDDVHYLHHGTTLHGAQFRDDNRKLLPTTYYNLLGPVSDIFAHFDQKSKPQKVAALGLGIGSISCYTADQRSFDFYEIDKDVVDIAENPDYFSYLKDCGSKYSIILGDARLKIAEAPDSFYDLIFIDTFSSDNIPVHIMTKEAFETYLKKLKPGGVMAINISNRYLDLRWVLDAIAKDLRLSIAFKLHNPEKAKKDNTQGLDTMSIYAVIGKTPVDIAYFMEQKQWRPLSGQNTMRPWTDNYANILSSLHFLNKEPPQQINY